MTTTQKMWVEKYRPRTLDDIIGHENEIARLKQYIGDDEIPHMIFSGPPGTGKTAAIQAFAREVYGDSWQANLDEFNASDDRGIDTVRNKLKGIARASPAGEAQFSILFLDEADALTTDAQKPLRRIMEDHADVTRWFLSCNYPNQIIGAIQSRCAPFRFGRLSDDETHKLLARVIDAEDLEVDDLAIEKLVRASRGDARSAINSLQSSAVDGEVTEDSVETVIGIVNDHLVEQIVEKAIAGEIDDAMRILDMDLIKQGANTQLLADSFLRVIKRKDDIPAPGKRKIIHKLAEADWRIKQAANPNVQWHSFLADVDVCYHLDHNSYEQGGD